MKFEFRLAAFAAFLVVLLGLAAWARAQALSAVPVPPMVIAGPDIGFRVTSQKGDMPVGQLVVRMDGQWKVVEFGSSLRLVK